MSFVKIILQQKIGTENNLLTYRIPHHIKAAVGQLAVIPLRKKITTGLIWELTDQKPDFKTSEIINLIDEKPLLNSRQIELINWMSNYYFCPLPKIIKLFIPKRVFSGKPVRQEKSVATIKKISPKTLTEDQKKALKIIQKAFRSNKEGSKQTTFLLRGITGSGKTEIYVNLAREQIKLDKQVLILVPEISLTPQTIEYFEQSLGLPATVIHSKISETERYKAWQEIWQNKSKLIIGSRSAMFSPFQNLGLIIIDEEHELSYKQEQAPRYSINKVVEKMQKLDPELKIILGSATPSIETAEKFKDATVLLPNRIGLSTLPEIEIVDLREEFKKQNYSIFSERLKTELEGILAKKQQAILFLNRRGTASSIVCRDCGHSENCPDCELALTYHTKTLNKPSLICHHCGKIFNPPTVCKNCRGHHIKFLGVGTQKIETELLKEFPQAKVLRADKDTTSKKNSFKEIYKAFKNHEADILVGTQMIAKGLHLPKVNLVGIILADIGLNIPDFRTSERTFQLITQVSGRAGRSQATGKVIIQTYNPDHIALMYAQNQDYSQFFQYERTQRKILGNPPFSQLAKITIEDKSLQDCKNQVTTMEKMLKTFTQEATESSAAPQPEILSYPAYITRLRGKYRYIILIKDGSGQDQIHNLLEKLPKEYIIRQDIKIDIDPITIT